MKFGIIAGVVIAVVVAGIGGYLLLKPGVGPSDDQQPPPQLTSDFTPPTGKTTGPEARGPWNMRLMSATSTDGLTFTRTNKVITDQGDVPDLIQDNRGWIYLYYVGWTVGAEQNKTVVAISTDGGSTWVYKRVNLSGFGAEMAPAVDPDVQILPDGTFRLYLTSDPHDGQGARTYYAEGTDGINFTNKGVAFSRPGKPALDPSTLIIGATWHYFAGGATTTPFANWYATSSDGRIFTFVEEKTFTRDGVKQAMANGIAVLDGYRFYTFSHADNPVINSFFTTDGVTWTPDSGTRLTVDTNTGKESWGVKDPAILKFPDGTYLMVYVTAIP